MKNNIRFLSILLFITCLANAQTNGCVDSLKLKQRMGMYCDPYYQPVCGCDGITYRNVCNADNAGLLSFGSGICENIAMDINPNPTINDIYIRILTKVETDINFYIFDHFGRLLFVRKFSLTKDVYYPMNLSEWDLGIYIIIAETNGDYVYKKINKQDT